MLFEWYRRRVMNVTTKRQVGIINHIILTVLLLAAAVLLYSPVASAGYYQGYNGHYYNGYSHGYYRNGNISTLCVDSPMHQCFLVADFVHNCPYPFFLRMDEGFYYQGHYYQYYHRYYTTAGYNEDGTPYYHTYYYYTY